MIGVGVMVVADVADYVHAAEDRLLGAVVANINHVLDS